jgi:hypothetical protein
VTSGAASEWSVHNPCAYSALASADDLYFKLCDEPGRDELLKLFPGRRIFVYEYPGKLFPYTSADSTMP